MKNKYTIGPDGNLISESFISNILNEQGKSAAELAAEARAKRAASGSAQPATTTTKTTASTSTKTELDAYKLVIEKGNFRVFEYIINETVFTSLMFIFRTGVGYRDQKNVWDSTKDTYFKKLTSNDHPFKKTSDWTWWYDESKKNLFGPASSFKANIENEDGWFYDNVWLQMIQSLDKIEWYKSRKNDPTVKYVFDNVYRQMDTIISEWYNVADKYKIEFPYVTGKLRKNPDEVATYFEHANAVLSKVKYKEFTTMTLIEQLQEQKDKGLQGILNISDIDLWKEKLTATSFTCNIGKEVKIDYVILNKPKGHNR